MEIKLIQRKEIEKLREINRREIVEQLYYYKSGKLFIKNEFVDDPGWTSEEFDIHIKDLYNVYDQGGFIYGAFDDNKIVGIAALGSKFIGLTKDQLQVIFFHVDIDYRNQGLGTNLMKIMIEREKKKC
ncbi:MAG: GNAT family N-acetyltransferase [Promethearchaeota archaeon]